MPAVARDLGGLGTTAGRSARSCSRASGDRGRRAGDATARAGGRRTSRRSRRSPPAACSPRSLVVGACCSRAGRSRALGAGALGVVTYASASRAYPPEMYGRMLALMSSAWVLPSLAGPAVAGFDRRDATGAGCSSSCCRSCPSRCALTLPGPARARRAPGAAPAPRRLAAALALAAGTGGLPRRARARRAGRCRAARRGGLALALPALRALLPAGTLRAARGLPSGVLVRGLLAVALPRLRRVHAARADRAARLQLLAGRARDQRASLSWSLGSFLQARPATARDDGAGRPQRALQSGWRCCSPGIAVTGAGVLRRAACRIAVAIGGWTIAGLGIGIGYASVGALVL